MCVDSWRLWVVVHERTELFALHNSAFWCVVLYGDWWRLLQTTLERHVNGHFNQSEAGNGNAGARRSLESASSKLFRRNGKKLRYRRQPWSGRAVCTGSHHQLLPNHMHEISSEWPLNCTVDGAFIRCTVACIMYVPFGFGNWMSHTNSLSDCVKTDSEETKNGFREVHWTKRTKTGKCIYIYIYCCKAIGLLWTTFQLLTYRAYTSYRIS